MKMCIDYLLDIQKNINPEHEFNLREKLVKTPKKKCEKYDTLC